MCGCWSGCSARQGAGRCAADGPAGGGGLVAAWAPDDPAAGSDAAHGRGGGAGRRCGEWCRRRISARAGADGGRHAGGAAARRSARGGERLPDQASTIPGCSCGVPEPRRRGSYGGSSPPQRDARGDGARADGGTTGQRGHLPGARRGPDRPDHALPAEQSYAHVRKRCLLCRYFGLRQRILIGRPFLPFLAGGRSATDGAPGHPNAGDAHRGRRAEFCGQQLRTFVIVFRVDSWQKFSIPQLRLNDCRSGRLFWPGVPHPVPGPDFWGQVFTLDIRLCV